nr:sulfotransferase [uncultured Desulfobacter sp.]
MVAQIDKQYLKYGFGKTVRRFFTYVCFEGRQLTTKGRWANPFIFGFLRLLSRIPTCHSVKEPVFITGLGRSGTTILGTLLSIHSDVGYLNEPKAIWHILNNRQDLNANFRVNREGGLYRLDSQDVTQKAKRYATRIYRHYTTLIRSPIVVDKYPELIFRVAYVKELFPDAKIIFIIRNGVGAIHSIEKWSENNRTQNGETVEDWWGRDDIKWKYLCEQILLKDPLYENIWPILTKKLDHVNRAALEWISTMREGLKYERIYPDSIIRVRYEDLLDNPSCFLENLQTAICLPIDAAVADYARKRIYPNKQKPWPVLHDNVEKIFKETMQSMGYGI